ncbi:MAG: hypothetical protein JWQ09_769, partial [Segetibacter sp.]|nr:hypothetical protein [Segetibacter sp.]
NNTYAQGCVAIRSTGGYCSMQHADSSKWLLSINNRYFKSFRHFVGTEEQKQRQTLGNEVINHSIATDVAITRKIGSRWSFMLDMPILSNSRSSLYEHSNVGRFTTHSFGVGDMRIALYRWLWNPEKLYKGNLQVGLGVKLPTGAYNYQDYFRLTDSTKRLGAVDQSIQLGDGGTGITLELNGFYNLSHSLSLYGNFYYLSNPREQNGVSTARGGTASASAIANGSDVMSVPDQLMIRAGANFMVHNFTFSAGLREEVLPVEDLIGGSSGFRRPGRILTVEPGITYNFSKVNVFAYVPTAISRNRTQSVADRITTQRTGKFTQGDAAFADYSINIGASFRF